MPNGCRAVSPPPNRQSRKPPRPAAQAAAPTIARDGATQSSKRNTQGKVQAQALVALAIGQVHEERPGRRTKRHAHAITQRQLHLSERSRRIARRSEEHTSELQSLMRISYAVFCL